VAVVELVCVECSGCADTEARAWQGHLVDADDDGEDEVVFYCPLCAAQEFGDYSSAGRSGTK
jgi:hypothetical protein